MSMYSQVSISLSLEQIHRIDELAKFQKMSRSQFLRTVVQNTIERVSESRLNQSINRIEPQIMQSLEYKISKLKLELRGLEYQQHILKDQGLDYD
jgi:metal-responsive CopG/Arc/MetJ family transcriptional regulator